MREDDALVEAPMWAAGLSFSSLSIYVYKPLIIQGAERSAGLRSL